MADANFMKIAFELQQDDEGYPPDKWETLWATPVEEVGLYQIDNIPLYVKGISSEDVVKAEEREGQLQFLNLVRASMNSVYRLYVTDVADVQTVRDSLSALGCKSEGSYVPRLVAMEIPGKADFVAVENLLEKGAASGRWAYEVGVLRHQVAVQ